MNRCLFLTGLALGIVCAAPGTAGAQSLANRSAEAAPPSADQVRSSRAVVHTVDEERLSHDQDYAREILGHLDVLDAAADDPRQRLALDPLRLVALHSLQQRDVMRSVIDRMLEQRPREGDTYYRPFIAALQLEDKAFAVRVWEVASESVPGVGRTELRQMVDPQIIWMLFDALGEDQQLRSRLAQALFRIGWPGDSDQIGADAIRMILVEDRLDHGDPESARGYAASLSTPETLRRLLVVRRYDAIVAPGEERVEVLRRSLAERDRETADWVGVAPDNLRAVFDRAQFLRLLGRNDEAWALLQPFTLDVPQTVESDYFGKWLINIAADALVELHRDEDAVRLIHQLTALPVAQNLDLIGPDINFAELLLRMGRNEEALEHATWLDSGQRQHANRYGQMWIDTALVCSLARLHRRTEALQRLERMRAQEDTSRAALMRAHLCLGDEDSAASLLVQQLGEDSPGNTLLQLQDYSIPAGRTDEMDARLRALRERPEVRAAVERVGRILSLPIAASTLY